jgi:hypothetical protein
MTEATTLEQHLGHLLQVGRFDPPRPFAEQAAVRDPSVYDRAMAATGPR